MSFGTGTARRGRSVPAKKTSARGRTRLSDKSLGSKTQVSRKRAASRKRVASRSKSKSRSNSKSRKRTVIKTTRQSRRKSVPPRPVKVTRASPNMKLTDLQFMAKSRGIPFGGLSKVRLANKINAYM